MASAINAISSMASGAVNLDSVASSAVTTNPTSTDGAPFADLMKDSINQVNELQDQAQVAVQGLMTGSGVDVHQAMIATQKATMAFELSLSVRNKAIQAYQSVMGMQF